jgi:dipeptidyl-peptidase-4
MQLNPIPLEDVARAPVPGGVFPTRIAFSPDGRMVTFLNASQGSLVRQLFAYDVETNQTRLLLTPPGGGATEDNLSLEEKLRRERLRQLDLGITSYHWAPVGMRMLLPLPDGLYMVDEPGGAPRLLVSSEKGALLDPKFSPDGDWIAYVQSGEVWVVAASGGEPGQITHGAQAGLTHGLAEYIAQEEMGRGSGLWWSMDSQFLAFEEADERHIPVYRIVHQGKDTVGVGAQEDHHYPFAGQANACVRLGVVSRSGGEPVWMDLGPDNDLYLARAAWLADGALLAQVENRDQSRLDFVRLNASSGERQVLFSETSDVWVNLHNLFWPLKNGELKGGFIAGSENSGFRHLNLYDKTGLLVRSLTSGCVGGGR